MEMKSPQTCPYSVTARRDPHRKARPTTTATKCHQNPTAPSSSTPSEAPLFPIEEILAMEVPKNPNPNPNSDSVSENLRVFLRIRPTLQSKDQNPKPRAKNGWPQNPAKKNSAREKTVRKKNSGDVCVTVNNSHSVTLSPPLALQESKRIKSEVYEGFSHVFATDSSQEQVFEKMVCPLVGDFLKGKSGMLAALGPSGSGKTHTVFGSPRDPGIVPRTLQQIFEPNLDKASECRRSFSISIFEIHSERGKGERIFDLCSGGAELSMQQSTIRGLQEVVVSDANEAESLIVKAMLRRLTASTNSNSQSSRSQCIINIRGVATNSDGEDDSQANNAVLSIIDLAGAEREKKTGNQGARLLESNFINNTSMVFGLCLRSLLEHQKNPKKPLQKHFQNSLLTRYLRDYLEGKRRMTLILTVKSEEENYLDTTYLLRQASPFMSIRFNNVEEQSNIPSNKRQSQAISRKEKPKRVKLSGSDACEIEERKIFEDERRAPVPEILKDETKIFKSEFPNSTPLELKDAELVKSERSYQILQNFAKALWTVLKQHGKQLKVAECEVQRLAENLKLEKTRNLELEKKLEDLKLNCTCSQQKSLVVALPEEETSKPGVELNGLDCSNVNQSNKDLCVLESNDSPPTSKINDSTQIQDQVTSSPTTLQLHSSYLSEFEAHMASENCSSNAEPSLNLLSHVQVDKVLSSNSKCLECIDSEQVLDWPVSGLDFEAVDGSSLSAKTSQQIYKAKEEAFSPDSKVLECVDKEQVFDTAVISLGVDVAHDSTLRVEISQQKCQIDATKSGSTHNAENVHNSGCFENNDTYIAAGVTDHGDDSCPSVKLDRLAREVDQELLNLPETGKKVVVSSKAAVDIVDSRALRVEKPERSLESSISGEDLAATDDFKPAEEQNTDRKIDKLSKLIKPKRRLLPASSSLLRDFNTLDFGDKNEKPKGNRGGNKFSNEESQGNNALLRLLQSNYRV